MRSSSTRRPGRPPGSPSRRCCCPAAGPPPRAAAAQGRRLRVRRPGQARSVWPHGVLGVLRRPTPRPQFSHQAAEAGSRPGSPAAARRTRQAGGSPARGGSLRGRARVQGTTSSRGTTSRQSRRPPVHWQHPFHTHSKDHPVDGSCRADGNGPSPRRSGAHLGAEGGIPAEGIPAGGILRTACQAAPWACWFGGNAVPSRCRRPNGAVHERWKDARVATHVPHCTALCF